MPRVTYVTCISRMKWNLSMQVHTLAQTIRMQRRLRNIWWSREASMLSCPMATHWVLKIQNLISWVCLTICNGTWSLTSILTKKWAISMQERQVLKIKQRQRKKRKLIMLPQVRMVSTPITFRYRVPSLVQIVSSRPIPVVRHYLVVYGRVHMLHQVLFHCRMRTVTRFLLRVTTTPRSISPMLHSWWWMTAMAICVWCLASTIAILWPRSQASEPLQTLLPKTMKVLARSRSTSKWFQQRFPREAISRVWVAIIS